MPDLIDIQNIFNQESDLFMKNVKANIERAYTANLYLRHFADTMSKQVGQDRLIIYGEQFFENVENGIPPLKGKAATNQGVREKIYRWTFAVGMSFQSDSARRRWARWKRQDIWNFGTKAWRNPALRRKNLYTPEIDRLVQSASQRIGKLIIDTKLV